MGSSLQHAGSFVVACGLLSSCGTRAPEYVGSVVAVCRLSCPVACGILVPGPGIESASPALEGGFSTTGPPGQSLILQTTFFFNFIYLFIFNFWLCLVLVAAHGIFVAVHELLSSCGTGASLQFWRLGFCLVVVCGFSLSSCGAWAPEHVGSVVCGMWAL